MAANGYNTGIDYTLSITTPATTTSAGGILDPQVITSFDAKRKTKKIEVKKLGGKVDHLVLPQGWEGTFEYERRDSVLDDYFADQELGYYAGQNQATINILETIKNSDGSVSQYRFIGVVFGDFDRGKSVGDDTVKPKVPFMASERQKVA